MQRELRLGLVLGVVVLAIVVIFWVSRQTNTAFQESRDRTAAYETVGGPEFSSDTSREGAPSAWPASEEPGAGREVEQPAATGPGGPGQPAQPLTTAKKPAGSGQGMGPGQPATAARETSPAPRKRTYKIQAGDTLWAISQEFYGNGKYHKTILAANKDVIRNAKALPVGQEIVIPDLAGTVPLTVSTGKSAGTAEQRHKVAKGETLEAIAEKYYGDRKKWRRIATANKIDKPEELKAGQTLVIPGD